MFMRPHASALTPRKTYRDIADGFDRMGNAPLGFAPPGFAPPGFYPSTGGNWPMTAEQWQACQTCGPVSCDPEPPNTVGRCAVVGLPRVCIPGCDCETIETTVCSDFTLTGVYISPKIADDLFITRFRIACWDMLANCDAVPASLFSCCEIDENAWAAKKASANSQICITFENESDEDVRISGALKVILCEQC